MCSEQPSSLITMDVSSNITYKPVSLRPCGNLVITGIEMKIRLLLYNDKILIDVGLK